MTGGLDLQVSTQTGMDLLQKLGPIYKISYDLS